MIICQCGKTMRVEKNGVTCRVKNSLIVWSGDRYVCTDCGQKIVSLAVSPYSLSADIPTDMVIDA